MIFALFRSKEEKKAIADFKRFVIKSYRRNKGLALNDIGSKLAEFNFRLRKSDRRKIFAHFVDECLAANPPLNCIEDMEGLAQTMEIEGDSFVETKMEKIREDVAVKKRIHDIKTARSLAPIEVDILLKRKEEAYFHTHTTFYEERTKRHYKGGSKGTSIRVAKGLSFRVGGTKGEAVNEDYLKEIDSGDLFITNKRIVFGGISKNWQIALAKLLRCQNLRIDGALSLSLSTETTTKKKYITLADETEVSVIKALIQRLVRGADEVEETKQEKHDSEDVLIIDGDGMEDETL